METAMSVDPIDDFLRRPLREQLDTLVKAWTRGSPPADAPWLSQGVSQALLMRILIESSHRLEGLTRWLVRLTVGLVVLTVALAALTGVLAYDVVRHLIGN